MAEGLQQTVDALDGFCAMVERDLYRVLDQTEALLQDALNELAGFDQDASRRAVAAVKAAHAGIRNARYGFLNDYVNLSQALGAQLRET